MLNFFPFNLKKEVCSLAVSLVAYNWAYCQDIRGTWLQVRSPGIVGHPLISIFEIGRDTLYSYNFNVLEKKVPIKIYDSHIEADSLTVGFKFQNENIMELKVWDESDNNLKIKYVRVLPTVGDLDLIESFHSHFLKMKLKREDVVFELDQTDELSILEIGFPRILANKVSIEEFDKTFFLCFSGMGIVFYAFPIVEVTKSSMVINGIPFHDDNVVVEILKRK